MAVHSGRLGVETKNISRFLFPEKEVFSRARKDMLDETEEVI
jgi:hypothetical protein